MDSNPFESLKIFCFGLLRNCLNCDYNFDGHIFISKEILLPRYGSFIIITTFVLQVDVLFCSDQFRLLFCRDKLRSPLSTPGFTVIAWSARLEGAVFLPTTFLKSSLEITWLSALVLFCSSTVSILISYSGLISRQT